MSSQKYRKVTWTVTRICSKNCGFCCLDAYYASESEGNLIIYSNATGRIAQPRNLELNLFDDASTKLRTLNLELSLEEKTKILTNIDVPVRLNMSGLLIKICAFFIISSPDLPQECKLRNLGIYEFSFFLFFYINLFKFIYFNKFSSLTPPRLLNLKD